MVGLGGLQKFYIREQNRDFPSSRVLPPPLRRLQDNGLLRRNHGHGLQQVLFALTVGRLNRFKCSLTAKMPGGAHSQVSS
jgi:hypothetical protein